MEVDGATAVDEAPADRTPDLALALQGTVDATGVAHVRQRTATEDDEVPRTPEVAPEVLRDTAAADRATIIVTLCDNMMYGHI